MGKGMDIVKWGPRATNKPDFDISSFEEEERRVFEEVKEEEEEE